MQILMLILLSPAKNMNFDPVAGAPRPTQPALLAHTKFLAETARKLTRGQIGRLMKISDQLAELNYERFQHFDPANRRNVKPAALAFAGDVYRGLDAASLTAEDLAYAQSHLRILSGFYGLLRPLDGVQPYRLEMGRALKNPRGKDLYAFWGDEIARELTKATKKLDDPTIVNLASKEYFTAARPELLEAPIVTPVFKEEKDGNLRQLQFFAKRARGLMARYAIKNRLERIEDLKGFDLEGYSYRKSLSSENEWIFTRPQPAKKAA
ncbi:MAG: peroxide stress protein YaaA [Parvularculaceae bacterium]